MSSALVNDSASVSGTPGEMRERESYLAFQGCSPEPASTFGAVLKFEVRSCDDAHARRARAAPLATTTTRAHHTPTAAPARSTATMAQRNVPPPQGETRTTLAQLLMAIMFAVSFSFATKRKRKLLAIQHHRIAQYLS